MDTKVTRQKTALFPLIITFALLYFVMGGGLSIAIDKVFDVLAPTIPYEPGEIVIVDGMETEPFWDILIEKYEPLEDNLVWATHIPMLTATICLFFIVKIPAVQNRPGLFLRVSALAASASVLIIWLTNSTGLLIAGTALMTLSAAFALGLLLWCMSEKLKPAKIGLVIGCGFALHTVLSIAMSPTYWTPSLLVLAITMMAASLAAALIPLPQTACTSRSGDVDVITLPLSPGFIAILASVMFLCGAISDIMANHLFYFWEVYYLMPYLLFGAVLHVTTIAVCVLSGFLFDKYTKILGFFLGLLLLGMCQAFILFFDNPWMGIPYSIFNTAGPKLSDVFIIGLPVYLASQSRRKIPPYAGLFIMSLYTLAVRFGFTVINPETYELGSNVFNTGLGIALILTFAALALVFTLFRAQERHERKVALAAVQSGRGEDSSEGNYVSGDSGLRGLRVEPAMTNSNDIRQKLIAAAITPLTPRELEVAELTILGIKRKIIADTLFIQSSTVDSHRISIYSKFGVHNRDELLKVLNK